MTEDLLSTLWRRRTLFLGTMIGCLAAVVLATALLPTTYDATAVLVAQTSDESTSAEQLVRTYSALAVNTNIVDLARAQLPVRLSRDELLDRMSFAPVARTQLLEISAEGATGPEAQAIANTYATVFAARVRDQTAGQGDSGSLVVSEPASVPANPSRSVDLVYLGLGVALALLLAVGVVVLREIARPSLSVDREAAQLFGLPILARVPKLRGRRDGEPSVIAVDAFGWLAMSLDHAGEKAPAVIVVTSPVAGDGKSTVVEQLALALVRNGERTVVVEADLRRPGLRIDANGGYPRAEIGLYEHLTDDGGPVIQANPAIRGLSVVWAGSARGYTGSLLGSPRFTAFLQRLLATHDRIVIDTPALAVGTDAATLAAQAQGVICVIDADRTGRDATIAGLRKLESVQAPVFGIVLNRAALVGGAGYYGADDRTRLDSAAD